MTQHVPASAIAIAPFMYSLDMSTRYIYMDCRSAQELKCSLKGLALEPCLTVSQPQLLFGEVASHDWADQNLVIANQGSSLPLRFTIPPSPYFHCLPDQGRFNFAACCACFAALLTMIHTSTVNMRCQRQWLWLTTLMAYRQKIDLCYLYVVLFSHVSIVKNTFYGSCPCMTSMPCPDLLTSDPSCIAAPLIVVSPAIWSPMDACCLPVTVDYSTSAKFS